MPKIENFKLSHYTETTETHYTEMTKNPITPKIENLKLSHYTETRYTEMVFVAIYHSPGAEHYINHINIR